IQVKSQGKNLSRNIIFSLVMIFLYLLIVMSVNFSDDSILKIFGILSLGFLLTSWHGILGILSPKILQKVWSINHGDGDDPKNELHSGFYHYLFRVAVPIIMAMYTWWVAQIINNFQLELFSFIVIFLYIVGPTIFLHLKRWYFFVLSIVWVWFPVEWNLINDHLGVFRFELVPVDALLGLFAMYWALIVTGRHIPWYNWDISRKELHYVNVSILSITLAVVPAGMLMYFLKINPNSVFFSGDVGSIVLYLYVVFFGIFVVQGLMEEMLFRDIIFKQWWYRLVTEKEENKVSSKFDLGHKSIIFSGLVVVSIPWWDEFLGLVAKILPFEIVKDAQIRVGSLDMPLGNYEGAAIPIFRGMEVWPFYMAVGLLFIIGGLWYYHKNPDPVVAALISSGLIFGFAHFQDWRYVLFATFAGIGYGYAYYKTRNIVPAAAVHMGVDAVWTMLLSYSN
ncbi:MAG: CPBP family intramembrane metalloprotease, partial [Candidatus Heimdallarchaeota archaeon]|nr:CPBP family intramembrane metalloprotease [Candidatus Heimdallarchaeota archaeon]